MGTDCYAYAGVGFEVSQEDFLQTVKTTVETCGHGHARPELSGAKFCPEDGTKYEYREILVPTPALIDLWASSPKPPDADEVKKQKYLTNWWYDFRASGDVFAVAQTCESKSIFVCGRMLEETRSHRMGFSHTTKTQSEVGELFKRAEKMREKLGPSFADRPIKLYSWLYVSY